MNEGEFQKYLEKRFAFSQGLGIGDDAAVIKNANGSSTVITKDILIENIHFKLDYFSIKELAAKAIAVNLSDIAAMGAVPKYFLLGLGVPDRYSKDIKLFFNETESICKNYNIELAGGDYSKSDLFFISVTMIGETNTPVLRKNAKTEDYICITKNPGESSLGLKLLEKDIRENYIKQEKIFIDKHIRVVPELKNGSILSKYANSMMDISDGLIKDLKRILEASQKGAIIHYEKIPVSDTFKTTCSKHKINILETVLSGGEDYGLLFTISKGNEIKLKTEDILYTVIGKITETQDLKIVDENKTVEINFTGYDHFLTKA